MSELLRRQAALEKTLAKYRNKPCDFRTADCVRMARFHLLQMGHKPPALPKYQSAIGARRALLKAGGMISVLDQLLPRIPAAKMPPGDLAVLDGEASMEATVICLGHKMIGWHEEHDEMVLMEAAVVKAAWRA